MFKRRRVGFFFWKRLIVEVGRLERRFYYELMVVWIRVIVVGWREVMDWKSFVKEVIGFVMWGEGVKRV